MNAHKLFSALDAAGHKGRDKEVVAAVLINGLLHIVPVADFDGNVNNLKLVIELDEVKTD
jgi:hypothetical protein